MRPKYSKENSGHENSFEVGDEFQDFVCLTLNKESIIIQNINTKKYQFEVGENLQGFEIKYDSRSTGCGGSVPTGRVSIEIAEKSNASIENFTPSGIYRGDNAWLYIIGNYDCFWIFSVKHLILMHKTNKYETGQMPTIKKFYLPIEVADKYCLKKYIFNNF